MIYSINKMKEIVDSISTHLTVREKEIMEDFLEKYNRLFLYAKDRENYIDRKAEQYKKESEENDRLVIQNRALKEKIERLKNLNKDLQEQNKKLVSKNKKMSIYLLSRK